MAYLRLPEVTKRTMRPLRIVFSSPGRNDFTSLPHRNKPMFIQEFITELAVETLDVGILLWLARFNEAQLQSVCIGPGIDTLTANSGPSSMVIDCGNPRSSDSRDCDCSLKTTPMARHSRVYSSITHCIFNELLTTVAGFGEWSFCIHKDIGKRKNVFEGIRNWVGGRGAVKSNGRNRRCNATTLPGCGQEKARCVRRHAGFQTSL